MKINVIFCDDHLIFREALSSFLNQLEDISCEASFSDGNELLRYLDKHTLPIDVILLDINMPNMDGYETMQHLKRNYPNIPILIFTMFSSLEAVSKAFDNGAKGFLCKTSSTVDLHNALKSVSKNNFFVNEFFNLELIKKKQKNDTTLLEEFTKKEKELIPFFCSEMSLKEIAECKHLSIKTLQRHNCNINKKMSVNSRVALFSKIYKLGLLKVMSFIIFGTCDEVYY